MWSSRICAFVWIFHGAGTQPFCSARFSLKVETAMNEIKDSVQRSTETIITRVHMLVDVLLADFAQFPHSSTPAHMT